MWWQGLQETLSESEVERELREGLRFQGVRETVRKYQRLSVKCRISIVVKVGRRHAEKVSSSSRVRGVSALTVSQRTWDVDFSKRKMLGNNADFVR